MRKIFSGVILTGIEITCLVGKVGIHMLGYDFDLEKMLINITNVVNIRAEAKYQNFVVNLNKGVPLSIFGDELRLSQVITNLLTNAIKFTPEYGKVILKIEKDGETGDEIILKMEVSDSGIGISEDRQKLLFTSFEQGDNSISQKFGGTGLGLAISKRIVELMNGRIWIESELDKGAKFIFTVKLKKGKEKADVGLNLKINKDDIRILAVDDSDEMRDYFAHVMDSFNLPCDVAASGEEALELINKCGDKPYNVFFIDWKMPGMDGLELAKKIKEITCDSSVITMLSSADWYSIEDEAIAAGVKRFIPKPLFPSILVDAINECFGVESAKIINKSQRRSIESHFNFDNYTILVAEDNEINREILAAVLEKTGVLVDFAENGIMAVSMFEENHDRYSLILMDVQMPEMDGYEATRIIRSFEFLHAKDIPIIAMTANVFREDIENCLSAGMNDHIGKPIDPDVLYTTIKRHITSLGKSSKAMKVIADGIAWDETLSLGNEQIDLQHHQMFEFLSSLVDACAEGTEAARLNETLEFLEDYTVEHFLTEEALLRQCSYPEYEKHKQMHEDFKITIDGLVQRFKKEGSSTELNSDVSKIEVRWLLDHIQKKKKKIGMYIRSIEV
jgi:hemerythrin-like metal-binding protein